jgi:hypothetical protein
VAAQEQGSRGDGCSETTFCEVEGGVDENAEDLEQERGDSRVINFTDRCT